MKITLLRTAALGAVAALSLLASSNKASAAVDVGIRVGGPPPAYRAEHPWGRPYRGAVWIPGSYEWRGGGWVWVGGYYGYPPRRGAVWVPGHYRRGYYRPGHWR